MAGDDDEANREDFRVWVNREPNLPGCLEVSGVTLHDGKLVYSQAKLSVFGDAQTGEIGSFKLKLEKHSKRAGEDFSDETLKDRFDVRGDALVRLKLLLDGQLPDDGRFVVVDVEQPVGEIVRSLQASDVDLPELAGLLGDEVDPGVLSKALARSVNGLQAAEAAVIEKRRLLLTELRELAEDTAATETKMHALMKGQHWLFGGRYVAVAPRQKLTFLDEFDIPLVTASGRLHIVELKGPVVHSLIKEHRQHWIMGREVHEAVSQTMSYLRELDEQAPAIHWALSKAGKESYNLRRAVATVVIGHPDHMRAGSREQLDDALRTYNSHLSRIEVVTYEDLFDTAARSLEFEQTSDSDEDDESAF